MSLPKFLLFVIVLLQLSVAKAQIEPIVKIRYGSSVTLNAGGSSAYSYQWYKDGRAILGEYSSSLNVSLAGSYQVLAVNRANCQSELSDVFKVFVEFADLEVKKVSDLKLVGADEEFEYQITAKNNGNTDIDQVVVTDVFPSRLLFVGTNNVEASFENGVLNWRIPLLRDGQSQTLIVKAKGKLAGLVTNTAVITGNVNMPDPNLSNNTSSDTKNIIGNIRIPNVITPNGDGKNDVFRIQGIERYPKNTLAIFNRWGNEVYRSATAYKNNWNGNGLSEGTYYYVLKIISKENKEEAFTGWVTILKDK